MAATAGHETLGQIALSASARQQTLPVQAYARPAASAQRNNFDALRLAAALLVVYGHQAPDPTGTFGLRLVLFFAISGYLVSGSWRSDPHAGRFLVRRFLRVWPAYAAMVVACALGSLLFPAPDMPSISRLASMFYLSNLWFAGFDWGFFHARNGFMNQSIWMMRYEVDIYLAFAAAAFLRPRWIPAIAAAVLFFALRAPETRSQPGGLLECWSLYFGGFFCFGVLLREFPMLRRLGFVLAFSAAGVAVLAAGERTAGLLLIIPPAVVWVGEQSWPVLRFVSRHGDLSLGIFLWAWPVHQVTEQWMHPQTPLPVQLAIVGTQALALAWLSWHAVEAPALRRKPKKPSAASRKRPDWLVTA